MPAIEKIVVVTRKTGLEELVERFNTRAQSRFYLEHTGATGSFEEYQQAHDAYFDALSALKSAVPAGMRVQFIERSFLPTFTFGEADLVVTLGPDGLVVNTAKYLSHQPLLALNPDPQRIDGVLVPFAIRDAAAVFNAALSHRLALRQITMAKAELNDGQTMYALNDLFIGQQTHVSARYRLEYRHQAEEQSSSGIIVSTGAGSTGWFRSILTGAAGVIQSFTQAQEVQSAREQYQFDWEADYLYFSVREPFVSKTSSAGIVFGQLQAPEQLLISSAMPQNGVIFSDGVESDFLQFNSGSIARIGLAEKRLNLLDLPRPPARTAQRHPSTGQPRRPPLREHRAVSGRERRFQRGR